MFPIRTARKSWLVAVVVLVLTLGGCEHGTNQAMIDSARSLAPEGSEIIDVADNGQGPAIEVGDYWASIQITDAGLGPALLDAIENRAASGGWTERYRCGVRSGTTIGYSRDDFKVDVLVIEDESPSRAWIRIQRTGEGNPWPPECRRGMASL